MHLAAVALDLPNVGPFTYAVPAGLEVAVGDGVNVPFRHGERQGFVVDVGDWPAPDYAVKPISSRIGGVRLPTHLLSLCAWASRYYRCALGEVLAAAVPAPVRTGVKPERRVLIRKVPEFVGKLTERQQGVWADLPNLPTPIGEVLTTLGTSRGVIDKLIAAGAAIEEVEQDIQELRLEARDERFPLTDEQQVAVAAVSAALGRHETFLLYGVTGSGKTLVYLDLAEQVIAKGQQVLFLLPEIGLTPQLAARIRNRIPRTAVWHSGFTGGERGETWHRIAAGEVDLIVGTRSALFAPLPNPGLIIVDEEHDPSYKQESSPRYHARDLAIVHGQRLGVPVILGSATPSLETVHNGREKRYTVITLKKRPKGGALPIPVVVDMRQERAEQKRPVDLSRALVDRLRAVKAKSEQAIVLLNRRGWSPVISCKKCGEAVMCGSCAISLTWHRGIDRLKCHYCGHEQGRPSTCPACGHDQLSATGLGTEQLAALVQEQVPGMSVLRVDADTVAQRQGHARLFQAFAAGAADCLVGTQMVAKGLDFPRVTLVGVLSADKGLSVPEFRAAERTWQLIAQVAGRAGRGERPGEVVVQAFDPHALPIRCALEGRPRSFIDAELQLRREYGYPPFAGLVRIVWSGPDLAAVQLLAQAQAQRLAMVLDGALMLGPNPCSLAFLKDQHRWHVLIKAGSRGVAQALLDRLDAAGGLPESKGVSIAIDVDPNTTA